MKRLAKAAILIKLGDELKKNGSWCGQTHYQKAIYFLQTALKVPMDFSYMLYKYGPYSFDLRDEMDALEADGLFESRSTYPYGSVIAPTETGKALLDSFPKTLGKFSSAISSTAQVLGPKQVSELEKLVTALYVKIEHPEVNTTQKRAQLLHEIKPHIPLEEALEAVRECDAVLNKIEQ